MENLITFKVPVGFDKKENTLNGMPFISETIGDCSIERTCGQCKFRSAQRASNCIVPQARRKFGTKGLDLLATKLFGKEVAKFCPHFALFR